MGCTVNIGLNNELCYGIEPGAPRGAVVEEVIELLVFKLVKATKITAKAKKVKSYMVKPKKMKAKKVKAKMMKTKKIKA